MAVTWKATHMWHPCCISSAPWHICQLLKSKKKKKKWTNFLFDLERINKCGSTHFKEGPVFWFLAHLCGIHIFILVKDQRPSPTAEEVMWSYSTSVSTGHTCDNGSIQHSKVRLVGTGMLSGIYKETPFFLLKTWCYLCDVVLRWMSSITW